MTREEGKREQSERQTSSETRAGSEATRERGESRSDSDESSESRDGEEPDSGAEDDDLPFGGPTDDDGNVTDEDGDAGAAATDGGTAAAEALPDENAVPDGATGEDGSEARSASGDRTESDDEVEPIEVLVNLAENGEIDPWDIDIVEVTDAFLSRLDETDLRTSGRALFYASVLLRMKSDEMLTDETEEEPEPEPWELAMQGGDDDAPIEPGFDPVAALEEEMDRRLERKSTRGSPETLDELVRELREAERGSWWKESRSYDTSKSPAGFSRGTQTLDYHAGDDLRREGEPTANDVTHTAHNEDIEEVIADVKAVLDDHYDHGREEVLFVEIRDAGGRPVMSYLSLLFLAHRGAVRLQQDDLFGDLWVQDPAKVDADAGADGDDLDAEKGEVVVDD